MRPGSGRRTKLPCQTVPDDFSNLLFSRGKRDEREQMDGGGACLPGLDSLAIVSSRDLDENCCEKSKENCSVRASTPLFLLLSAQCSS